MRPRRRTRATSHAEEIRQLVDSRRVIVDAYEVERRRIERDLHDGAQQYFVAAAIKLGEAELDPALHQHPQLQTLLSECHAALEDGLAALRTTVRGIHPQTLLDGGLVSAVEELASGMNQPVTLRCPTPLPQLPEGVLACGYFFVSEALTNATKYAPGAEVSVLFTASQELRIAVVDDGPGGARITPAGGLHGMRERLAAFGGTLQISSPPGGPTQLVACVPLLLHQGEPGISPVPGTEVI